ncbi:MAG: hypothetical protein RQ729_10700 [Wenzhouxiangellaceae bacterium]|nr:hypothetical protein [Wenzhouxiangellaceae bacterium]
MPTERALAAAALALLLCACAAPSGTAVRGDAAIVEPGAVRRAALLLEGEYVGARVDQPSARVRLVASVERSSADGVELQLVQSTDDQAPRRFAITLEPGPFAGRLSGRFAPLDAQGMVRASCPLEVTVGDGGWLARTQPATCVFGQGEDALALSKEIAVDGRSLVIADRIDGAAAGPHDGVVTVLELLRLSRFEVRAAVREAAGSGDWRVAETFELASDGGLFTPVDAAGMSLGIVLELAPYRSGAVTGQASDALLRLRALDEDGQRVLGQAWADPDARRLGLALPGMQIGLRRLQ